MGPTQTLCLLLCYNKLCITPFINRWKHMVLLRPLSPGTIMLFVNLMPLSELTTESWFKTATLVRDWRDYQLCGRMFHPPILASNWILFCLCLNRDIYSTCCYCDILLLYMKHFAQCNCPKRYWISYSCWQIHILSWCSHERSVQAFIHMIVQCALRCCATCIGTILNKCWIEAIVF